MALAAQLAKRGGLRPTATRVRHADGSVSVERGEHLTEREQEDFEETGPAPGGVFMVEGAPDPQVAAVCPSSFLEGGMLFVGSQDAASPENLDALKSVGVSRILNVAAGVPNRLEGVSCGEEGLFQCSAIELLDTDDFPLIPSDPEWLAAERKDTPGIVDETQNVKLSFCFRFIDKARAENRRVLCHCNAGVSRSVTVVLSYVMVRNGVTLAAAMAELKEERSKVKPNEGFMKQLQRLDEALREHSKT